MFTNTSAYWLAVTWLRECRECWFLTPGKKRDEWDKKLSTQMSANGTPLYKYLENFTSSVWKANANQLVASIILLDQIAVSPKRTSLFG